MKTWGLYIAIALAFFIYTAATKVDRDSSGAIIGEGNVDAFQIRVGDCFNDIGSFDEEVTDLPGVPCSDPHDNETYAVLDLTITTYPEAGGMAELAHNTCLQHFDAFVGRDYESSSLDIMTLFPTTESWAQDDREVICAVYDMNAVKLVGSAKGQQL